jgi:cephalosporin hydroxylase
MNIVERKDMQFHCDIDGIYTCQNFEIEIPFYTLEQMLLYEGINVDLIIEIGTYKGGFTTFLSKSDISNNADIHTFDINASMGQPKVCSNLNNVTFHNEDVFETETIKNLVTDKNRKGNCMILCDGGNKIEEFNRFSDLLKEGDMIFAHDYAWDLETFETKMKGQHWDYCEVCYNDIEDAVKKNKLKPLLPKAFDRVAWASFVKTKV